ncbi:(2Fe-2S)-binding protein [Candidatus Omnitrophota bacterium]
MPSITLTVNKTLHQFEILGHETLLEILRDHLCLTGTKTACAEAECGACTVYVDGRSILSCITLAADCDQKHVTTIEGLTDGDNLHPIQTAFLEKGAVQCGFCIPGMIMAAKDLLDHNPKPTREEISQGLNGNICRCAGYIKIIDAVEYAAGLNTKEKNETDE